MIIVLNNIGNMRNYVYFNRFHVGTFVIKVSYRPGRTKIEIFLTESGELLSLS